MLYDPENEKNCLHSLKMVNLAKAEDVIANSFAIAVEHSYFKIIN